MPIRFECDHCHKTMQAPDGTEGKKARCPACEGISRIPGAAAPQVKAKPAKPEPTPVSAPAFESGADQLDSGNPYQSPVAVPDESRFGVPPNRKLSGQVEPAWERQPSFGSFFRTTWQVLTSPTETFRNMPREADLTRPLLYSVSAGAAIGVIAAGLLGLLLVFVAMLANSNPGGGGEMPVGVVIGIGAAALVGLPLMYAVLAPLGCFVGGGFLHLMMMMVGSKKYSYQATVRFTSYAYFASWPFMPLSMIPLIGPVFGLVSGVWMLVIYIIGLAEFHETTRGKAALAVLLPFGFFMVLGIGLVVLVAVIDATT